MGIAYLVRHFETESNAQGLFGDGPLDDIPTERGNRQVKSLTWVSSVEWNINEIWAGDSVRNSQTASALGFGGLQNYTKVLNEQHPGEWAGKCKTTDISSDILDEWRAGRYKIPGSESDEVFEGRVLNFWKGIALPKLKAQNNLLIAISGNPIRVILGHIWNTPWRNLLPALVIDNASVTVIKVNKDGKCFVGPVNDISHLKGVGVTPIPGT